MPLRSELRKRAEAWATNLKLPYYLSLGAEPTVLFEPTNDHSRHGNFHPAVWAAIRGREEWAQRLQKAHPRSEALPKEKRSSAKQLDSSNSSDALLMNRFSFPGGVPSLLTGLSLSVNPSMPVFGFPARLSPRCSILWARSTLRSWRSFGRRMFERELGVSRLLDRNHERHPSFGTPKRERLAGVLLRDGVHALEIAIRTVLDHATTKLGLLIGIVKIDYGER